MVSFLTFPHQELDESIIFKLFSLHCKVLTPDQDQVRHKLDTGASSSESDSSASSGGGEKLTRKLSRMIFGK